MKKNLRLLCSGGVLLCSCLITGSLQAQVKGDPSISGVTVQPGNFQKISARLSPDLQKLANGSASREKIAQSDKKPLPLNDGLDKYLQIKGDKVVVDITVRGDIAAAKNDLKKLGFQFLASYGRVLSGLMPISALPQLETATSIQFVKPAYKPMHQSRPAASVMSGYMNYLYSGAATAAANSFTAKVTPVISQGDTAQRSNLARKKYKVEGKGVKVGILSDSYNNLGSAQTGVLHGELPGPGNPFGYKKPVQVLLDLDSNGTDEGRAMAEIVHDVAPGAQLAFNTANNGQASFAQGIVNLANAGCDVIVDDVIYFAEPFFQDGIIAQAVDYVKSKGVTYFSSAGNSSIRSYESEYRPTDYAPLGVDNGTAHNFSAPGATPRYFQPLYVPTGGSIICSFQWDQPFFSAGGAGSESDYDVYLLNSSLQVVAYSAADNLKSGDPSELLGYFNSGANPTFYLLILKYTGPDASRLKYNLYNDALFYLTNPAIPGILAPALVGHAKAEGAIATGAAFYLETPAYGVDTPLVEGFSSVGGTANYFDVSGNRIAPLIRNKPEIVAPDGGNTSFFDPFGNGDIAEDKDSYPNFFGTSAAAPHAAGVAALMIEAQKLNTLKPGQIKGILASHTVDMDDPYLDGFQKGFDFTTGKGLIKADAAVGIVKFPNQYIKPLQIKPLCSTDPGKIRNWTIINPNPFEVRAAWKILGTSQHGSILVAPGDTSFSTNTLYAWYRPIPSIAILDWDDNFGFSRFDLAFSSSALCGRDAVAASNSDQLMSSQSASFAATTGKFVNMAEVYPNPSTSVFRVYMSLEGDGTNTAIEVFGADGRKLQTKRVTQSTGIVDIDASAYRPGIYLLKLTQGGFVKTIKVYKQ